jgi:hypothetical protein
VNSPLRKSFGRMAHAVAALMLPALCAFSTAAADVDVEQARAGHDRAIGWLLENQRENGAWATGALDGLLEMGFSVETYYAWQVASHGLAVMALVEAPRSPERDVSLTRALEWLTTTRLPRRGSDWDVDYVWSALYGYVALVTAAADPRVAEGPLAEAVEARGRAFARQLAHNETPSGGWAYYDDPPYTQRPKWATSFCTALVLPALREGIERGWVEDAGMLPRAVRAVRRSALPSGAFTYDASNPIPRYLGGEHIDDVKGSLGRIQVCHWGLARVGEPTITEERLRWGLEAFFEHHRFLRTARGRPIPHEGFYANAGYFYLFAHYYAAEVIELLPEDEREAWHMRLRPWLIEAQNADGSAVDFLVSGYMRVAGTAYLALALGKGLAPGLRDDAAAPASAEQTRGQ